MQIHAKISHIGSQLVPNLWVKSEKLAVSRIRRCPGAKIHTPTYRARTSLS